MSFFTSKRERRLWLWTLLAVAAIYTTLGVARPFAETLRSQNLLALFFVLGMALVGITILFYGLKGRPGGAEIGVALGVAAVYYMAFTRITLLEERTHLIEYGVVAAFIYEALTERKRNGRPVRGTAVIAWLFVVIIGWIDEGIQAILPSRVYDFQDVIFNALAGFMAIGGIWALRQARQWSGQFFKIGKKPEVED